jgi:diadenosine tetraphosphate (Ap4A) HIT family hydrolase
LIWGDARLRVVHVAEPGYAGYCRVIWNAHVREMTDLTEADRAHCMRVVFAVEKALRDRLHPEKMNLASLGNVTPHLHWHVVARFRDDPHFPDPVWGAPPLRAPVPLESPHAEFLESLAATLSRITRKL